MNITAGASSANSTKGESLHALRRFLFVANEGHIRKHYLAEQLVQTACLTLVTNAVIVWNTVYMQAALDQIKQDGFVVDDSDLQFISPARFEQVNPYGSYTFPIKQEFNPQGLRPLRNSSRESRIFLP